MIGPVDWTALAERLGTTRATESGIAELGGTRVAQQALAELLGDETLVGAVDHYLSSRPGFETARSVLRELRPAIAMEYCMEVFRTDPDIERVRGSIQLLGWIADARALEWYPELAAHEDDIVRVWAVGLIDQLWMGGEIEPQDAIGRLQPSRDDHAEVVRSRAEQVVEMIRDAMLLEAARTDTNN